MAMTDLSQTHNGAQGESTFHCEGIIFLLRLEPVVSNPANQSTLVQAGLTELLQWARSSAKCFGGLKRCQYMVLKELLKRDRTSTDMCKPSVTVNMSFESSKEQETTSE